MPSQDIWKFTPVSYRTSALWALRLWFAPWGWDLGLETGIWASWLEFRPPDGEGEGENPHMSESISHCPSVHPSVCLSVSMSIPLLCLHWGLYSHFHFFSNFPCYSLGISYSYSFLSIFHIIQWEFCVVSILHQFSMLFDENWAFIISICVSFPCYSTGILHLPIFHVNQWEFCICQFPLLINENLTFFSYFVNFWNLPSQGWNLSSQAWNLPSQAWNLPSQAWEGRFQAWEGRFQACEDRFQPWEGRFQKLTKYEKNVKFSLINKGNWQMQNSHWLTWKIGKCKIPVE